MRGIIELISPRESMIVVRTEVGDFSVLELLKGFAPEIGDVLAGNLDSLGGETVQNLNQQESWDVFIQDIHGSRNAASRMISSY